ncbi:MAG: nuclear transport factor 2 family protein [Marinifilaceae bacterium]|nr:nuclear transport factor 2 family protein [Marinifilaceae bacterium]
MEDIATKNKESVYTFYKAIENNNVDKIVSLFSENAEHFNPYHSDILPKGAKGRKEIRDYWTPILKDFEAVKMSVEDIYAMEDPNIVFVKAHGTVKMKSGLDYNNDYFKVFKFNDKGEIETYYEVFNPIVALKSFDLVNKLVENE